MSSLPSATITGGAAWRRAKADVDGGTRSSAGEHKYLPLSPPSCCLHTLHSGAAALFGGNAWLLHIARDDAAATLLRRLCAGADFLDWFCCAQRRRHYAAASARNHLRERLLHFLYLPFCKRCRLTWRTPACRPFGDISRATAVCRVAITAGRLLRRCVPRHANL